MKRTRLQHTADTLCHMFCGWRLINSGQQLEALGSGTLFIDAITESCEFAQKSLPRSLPIAGELNAWLVSDLAAHGIAIGDLRVASLSAQLQLELLPGKHGHGLTHCSIVCKSTVATDEKTYTSDYSGAEAWESFGIAIRRPNSSPEGDSPRSVTP